MNRLTACLVAAVLASGASVFGLAPQAQAATIRVTAADLGPGGPWFRLQDQPGNEGRDHGVQEVSPFAAPGSFDGSLHLAIGPGRQSQAAHAFPDPVPLGEIAASPLSYDSYVDGARSTAVGTGPNLQLPMFCRGQFTTLSFQPQLATDSLGNHGVLAGTWQHFTSHPGSLWRSSRAITGTPITAGSDAPLSTYVAACTGADSGVGGVIANVGTLGDPAATLDTYVDNLTVHGDTYDFAVDGAATGEVHLWHGEGAPHERTVEGVVVFRSPADGPFFRHVGTRITLAGSPGLDPDAVSLTANGLTVPLTRTPDGHLTGVAPGTHLDNLAPGDSVTTHLAITFRDDGEAPGAEPATIRSATHDNHGKPGGSGGSGNGDKPACGPGHPGKPGGPGGPGEPGGPGGPGGPGAPGEPGGTLTVTAGLLAHGYVPLQPTGVTTTATTAR
jgi:hypothetical protein